MSLELENAGLPADCTSLLGEAYSTTIQDSDPRLQNLKPPFEIQIRSKAKEVLVEDELARRR